MADKKPATHNFLRVHRTVDVAWRVFPTRRVLAILYWVQAAIWWLFLSVQGILHFAREHKAADSPQKILQELGSPERQSILVIFEGYLRVLLKYVHDWADAYELRILLCVGIIGAVIGLFQWFLRNASASNADVRKRALSMLEVFHRRMVPDYQKPTCAYRLTLFKARSLPYGFLGRWLGMCVRTPSGTHKKTRSVFSINTEHKERCTGVAADCWWHASREAGYPAVFYTLPSVTHTRSKARYLADANLTEPEFDAMACPPTRLLCHPVIAKGIVWGIVVFDTNDSEWCNDAIILDKNKDQIALLASTLSNII